MCQVRNDYSRGTLVHKLFECTSVRKVINHIKWNVTLKHHMSPIELILTNNICLKVMSGRRVPLRIRPEHAPCVIRKDIYDGLALDYIWTIVMSSLFYCVNQRDNPYNNIHNKHIAKKLITDMDNYIKLKGQTPLGC